MNALAMEALPIYLDAIVPSAYAILISVVAVLIFGEVIPQAVCTGPKQLVIARYTAPIVLALMYLSCPFTWPMSKILDCILGTHQVVRFKNE